MNTYLVSFVAEGITGTASLQAADDQQAAERFAGCNPDGMIVRMVAVFEDGVRVDREVMTFPAELGGGVVDLRPTPSVVCDCGKVIVSDDGMCGCGLHVSDLDYGPRVWNLHV